MLAGHYSAALAGKAVAPRAPLWSLFLAAQLVDIAWALCVQTGIEKLRLEPRLPSNPLDLYYMPYTHGLPATFVWAAAAFVVARAWLGDSRAALVIAGVTASHWLLDFLVHRPDLPLWGDAYKVGLALWDRPWLAWWTELALVAVTGFALWRAETPGSNARRKVAGLVAVLCLVHVGSLAPVPTSSPAAFATIALTLFVVLVGVAWQLEPSERA